MRWRQIAITKNLLGPVALIAAVLAGTVLRLAWGDDIEYKADEAYTFGQIQAVGESQPLSWFGMPSSVGLRNPGMSLWVFLLLGKLLPIQDPVDLAHAIQVLNVVAILTLIGFAFCFCSAVEREPWLWSAALLSVNPLAILFHRKIWPPSILPLFVSFFVIAWWKRDRWWAAFFWGLLGAIVSQVHLAAVFFAAGFIVWGFVFDRRRIAWKSWFAGSVVGVLPALPWLTYLLTAPPTGSKEPMVWKHIFECKFWLRWVAEPLGLGLDYTLEEAFPDFLRGPWIGGQPSYLLGALHLIVIAIGAWILASAARHWFRASRPRPNSPTEQTLGAVFWGCGLLMTLSALPIHRHYMVILYPFESLWLARLALEVADRRMGRTLLAALCTAQLFMSVGFLSYIHTHQGVPGREYGVSYGAHRCLD
jgi:hypothetical protein